MSTKKTIIPKKVNQIASQFKKLGRIKIEQGFDKSHWKILVACGGNMNVSDLFITLLQNGIHRFTPMGFGRIQINIHI